MDLQEITWKPMESGLNVMALSLSSGHYCTGHPEYGWVLYSRDGRGTWNQRTEKEIPPYPAAKPRRINGKWYWVPFVISVKRTGNLFSFSSVEFEATFPDGSQARIWSPPWSDLDYDDIAQDDGVMDYAEKLWEEKIQKLTP